MKDQSRIIDKDIARLMELAGAIGQYDAPGLEAVSSIKRICTLISNYERWLGESCKRAEHDWERNMAGKYDRGFWDAIEMADDQFGGMMEGKP